MRNIFVISIFLCICLPSFGQSTPAGLAVSQSAPMFTAKDQHGAEISLSGLLSKGPVVLVFYRGQWCPYCNRQLKALEDSLPLIQAKGATLVAVTPESVLNIDKTVEKTGARYPILFDQGMHIMRAYDVAFQVDTATLRRYKNFKIDLEAANGGNGPNLPVPAVYIIDRHGKIRYRFFDTDYKKRPSVRELLEQL